MTIDRALGVSLFRLDMGNDALETYVEPFAETLAGPRLARVANAHSTNSTRAMQLVNSDIDTTSPYDNVELPMK
jgi:hypothetical protein